MTQEPWLHTSSAGNGLVGGKREAWPAEHEVDDEIAELYPNTPYNAVDVGNMAASLARNPGAHDGSEREAYLLAAALWRRAARMIDAIEADDSPRFEWPGGN